MSEYGELIQKAGEEIEKGCRQAAIAIVIFLSIVIPLAIWGLIDLVKWIVHHAHFPLFPLG